MSGFIGTSHSKSKVIGRSQDTAKVWINFNGTGTVAIRDSFNVTSITDHGVGTYTVTFAKQIGNSNFAFLLVSSRGTGDTGVGGTNIVAIGASGNYIKFETIKDSSVSDDPDYVNLVVFGD